MKKILHNAMFLTSIVFCLIVAAGNAAAQSKPNIFQTALEEINQKTPEIYGRVETGAIHFIERQDGSLLG